ncbi:MAG: hypothetical protein KAT68_00910 [Bacteroidales bacterium]|nr:hypothetical protein [Bacteroidales bacterium]
MIKKLSIYLLLIAGIIISSCDKEDDDNTANVTEQKQLLTTESANVKNDLDEIIETEGVVAVTSLIDLFDLVDPFEGDNLKSFKIKTRDFSLKLRSLITSDVLKNATIGEDGSFNFSEHTGTYTWNFTSQNWDIQLDTPNDKIIIHFPTEGSTSNNATATLHKFEEQMFIDEGDTLYMPTEIEADLYINDTKYIEVDFSATWNDEGIPTSINITVYINPFTFAVSMTDNGTSIDASASLKKGSETIMAVGGTVTFTNADKENVTTVDGYVQYRDVKVAGDVDVASLDALEGEDEPTVAQMNQYINLAVYQVSTGVKIGDIEFFENIEDGETFIDVRIVFADGTTVLASVYFDPILQSIEDFLDENFPDW